MKHLTYTLSFACTLLFGQCTDHEFSTKDPRLDYYIESFATEGHGFQLQSKVTYHYDGAGVLQSYTVANYNLSTGVLEQERHLDLSYFDGKVAEIKGYLADHIKPYIEYSYTWSPDDSIAKITERNNAAAVNSEATFTYKPDKSIVVSYAFSNGQSFKYEFDYAGGNILSDKTTRGATLCSNGQYTYDQKKNPFNMLGYTDYNLTNLSANNKLTEDLSYIACAFPTLIPQSYSYEYNEKGYPVVATTTYKDSEAKSKREFFYVSQK